MKMKMKMKVKVKVSEGESEGGHLDLPYDIAFKISTINTGHLIYFILN